jgi:DNA ligase D-like protein (predicted ligase)
MTKQPSWVVPMLATLTDQRFSDPEWLFERKLDGERCLAFRDGSNVRLLSRNQLSLNHSYPEVVSALTAQRSSADFIVDGEVVAFQGGRTSFAQLQQRMGHVAAATRAVPVFYYLFDIVWLDGSDVTELPLRERKRVLRNTIRPGGPLRITSHRNTDGEAMYAEACRKEWEGVIAKRTGAPYSHGRSKDWLKFKCQAEQEFVIGGWTDPQGSRTGFGALLVGYHQDGELRYAGKVGTGYNRNLLASLGQELRQRERPTSPFADLPKRSVRVHWTEPELVAEVAFAEWTRDGRLRHPRFVGLRRDKPPGQVVRERPQP